MHQACAETTGALWSSRTMTVKPLSRVAVWTPVGSAGISAWFLGERARFGVMVRVVASSGQVRSVTGRASLWEKSIAEGGFFPWQLRHLLARSGLLSLRQEGFAEGLEEIVAVV